MFNKDRKLNGKRMRPLNSAQFDPHGYNYHLSVITAPTANYQNRYFLFTFFFFLILPDSRLQTLVFDYSFVHF